MSRFGFFVKPRRNDQDNWRVGLPHQCGSWMVSGDHDHGSSHEESTEALTRFIAEATEALKALKARRKYDALDLCPSEPADSRCPHTMWRHDGEGCLDEDCNCLASNTDANLTMVGDVSSASTQAGGSP